MTNLAPIPRHWSRAHLSHVSEIPITNGVGEAAQEYVEGSVRYIRTTDIAGLHHLDDAKRVGLPREVASAALVQNGDLLMTAAGSLGTSHLVQLSEPACYAGYLVRFRANPARANARFVAWWTQSRDHLDQIAVGAVRSTIDNFSAGKFRSMSMPRPPLEEQGAIAEFLDRETAKIDALIEKQNELVAILRERLAATILQETRPTLENLDGWNRVQLRRLAWLSTGSTPTGEHAELFDADGGLGWVTPEDLTSDVRPWRFLTKEGSAQLRRIPPASSLVCGIGATLGKVGYTTGCVATNQQITALIPKRNVVGRYLYYALVAERAQILGLSVGNTLPIINNSRLAQLDIWIPDATLQDQLARRLQYEAAKIDALIAKAEEFVLLAKERRAALITAAVTGQIDLMREAS